MESPSRQTQATLSAFWGRSFGVLVALVALAAVGSAQGSVQTAAKEASPPLFPLPPGNFGAGLLRLTLTDASREEKLNSASEKGTEKGSTQKRKLAIDLWYPARRLPKKKLLAKRSKLLSYVPGASMMRPVLEVAHRGHAEPMLALRLPIAPRTKPARSPRRFPVLVFSHGLRTARYYYTSQILHLVCAGYVVLSVDHSYDVEGVVVDGKLLRGVFDKESQGSLGAEAASKKVTQKLELWAADHRFLLNELRRMQKGKLRTPLKGRLDLDRMGLVGHCFGGMAALEALGKDKRPRAILAQNAWPPTARVTQLPPQKTPLLMLYSEFGSSADALLAQGIPKPKIRALQKLYHAKRSEGLRRFAKLADEIELAELRHMSFTDLAILLPWLNGGAKGSPASDPGLERIAKVSVAWLDRALPSKRAKKHRPLPEKLLRALDARRLSEAKD